MTAVLLLSSIHSSHARRSGYQVLAGYLPEAELLQSTRKDPVSFPALLAARVARRFSLSRWYLGSSASLEWKAFRRIRSGFRGIVHSMWADHDLGFLDLAVDRSRQKLCGTFHSCDDTLRASIRSVKRLRHFDAVILMSTTQSQFFQDAGVSPDRVHVVLHGVDTSYFSPAPARPRRFVVLSVGGHRRNFTLLQTICRDMEGDGDVSFEVVVPVSLAHLFTGRPNVSVYSNLDDERLLERYRAASCFLHTVEDATANNALLEAMACGLPIVTERIGGIPEYVSDDCAILADAGDVRGLASAIRRLVASPGERAAKSDAARSRAEDLAWANVAEKMRRIYGAL